MSTTTTGHRLILEGVRGDDIEHDPWGTALHWHFAICDLLVEWGPPYPPAEWGFRQAMGGPNTESWAYQEMSAQLELGEITAADLLKAGRILARFEALCKLAGRNY